MTFLSPGYLALLIAVAALAGAYAFRQLRRERYVARFSNVELLGSVAPRRPGWRRHLTFALLLVALTVLSLGVARPSTEIKVPRENATVILDIDVSLSMEATDVLPSRIEAAKTSAIAFAKALPPTINLGLVSFSLGANVVVAPTTDRAQIINGIHSLRLHSYTAIGEAIFASLQAIQLFGDSRNAAGARPAPSRIVLLSDGTSTTGRSIASAIAAAQKADVPVSTIAFGTSTGTVTINGVTREVPADNEALSHIAQSTGGSFHAAHSEEELRSVYADIGSQIGFVTKHHDVSWRFLLTGLLFLFAAGGTAMLWAGRLV
jgi:Ca-activated chloride channel family protein